LAAVPAYPAYGHFDVGPHGRLGKADVLASVRLDLAGQPTMDRQDRDWRLDVGQQVELVGSLLQVLRVLVARRYSRGLDGIHPVFISAVISDVPGPDSVPAGLADD
jgi:hypothetical protein